MLGRLFRKRGREATNPWDLSRPLLQWGPGDLWTIRDSVAGALVVGATGSGKTTGSGAAISRAFLAAGYGGLVLTAKADETSNWIAQAAAAGRADDLVIFGPDRGFTFNFLDHELRRPGAGAGLTENLVNLFSTLVDVAEHQGNGSSGGDDQGYWRRANRQLVRNCIDLLVIAKGKLTIPDLYRVVITAPTSKEQVVSAGWKETSFCFCCLTEGDRRSKSARQRSDFEIVADYFLLEYPALSDKTRSVVVSTFTSMVDILNRGLLRELIGGEANLSPEVIEEGKIVVVDLPVKEFADVGLFAQILWKYAFQKTIERRNVVANRRPVFLWIDEAQNFMSSYDMQFLTTCRAARVATVLLTQNVSNFYATLGASEKGRAEVDSLVANLNTKIFHANGDPVTNEWAARVIGRTRQFLSNGGTSYSAEDQGVMFGVDGMRSGGQTSAGFSETWEFDCQPQEFTQLRSGGPECAWQVDGIVFQNGRVFQGSGRTWQRVAFEQRH